MSKSALDTMQFAESRAADADIDRFLNSAAWEERLEEARLQREKVLAARGLSAPSDPSASTSAEQSPESKDGAGADAHPGETVRPVSGTAAPAAKRSVLRTLPRDALTLMVCCLFLGFGFALGLGLTRVIGITLGEVASPGPVTAASLAAPEMQGFGRVTPDPDGTAPERGSTESVAAPSGDTPASDPEAAQAPVVAALNADPVEDPLTPPAPAALVTQEPDNPLSSAEGIAVAGIGDVASFSGEAAMPDDISGPSAPDAMTEGMAQVDPAGPDAASPEDTLAARYRAAGGDPSTINLRVYAPDSVAKADLDANLELLEGTGFGIANTQRVGMKITTPHIRYYDAGDAEVAEAVAGDMGIEARDFSSRSPGAKGLIEVWFDGKGRNRVASRTRSSAKSTFVSDWIELRDHLARKLR